MQPYYVFIYLFYLFTFYQQNDANVTKCCTVIDNREIKNNSNRAHRTIIYCRRDIIMIVIKESRKRRIRLMKPNNETLTHRMNMH